jgi:hypothetical protein
MVAERTKKEKTNSGKPGGGSDMKRRSSVAKNANSGGNEN